MAGTTTARAQDGFFFRQPVGSLTLRIGVGGPIAQDDLFDFFTSELTLKRGDFRTVALGADFAIRAGSQVDVVLGIAHDASSNRSEFTDWVDQDDQPIEQTTKFSRTPLTASAKVYLRPRGRAVSQFAWIPSSSFTPYVLVGGGVMFYDLKQEGDFVDFETLNVFNRQYRSAHAGGTLHAGAGAEWWVSKTLGITADARYSWGSADLEYDFSDFGDIDLSGFQLTTGISIRY